MDCIVVVICNRLRLLHGACATNPDSLCCTAAASVCGYLFPGFTCLTHVICPKKVWHAKRSPTGPTERITPHFAAPQLNLQSRQEYHPLKPESQEERGLW